jgi:hypothetical protein
MPCRLRQRFRVDFSRGASLGRLERRRKFATAPISLHGENLITRFRLTLAARANARHDTAAPSTRAIAAFAPAAGRVPLALPADLSISAMQGTDFCCGSDSAVAMHNCRQPVSLR